MVKDIGQLAGCLKRIQKADRLALPMAFLSSLTGAMLPFVSVFLISWLVDGVHTGKSAVQMYPVAVAGVALLAVLTGLTSRFQTIYLPHMENSNDQTDWAFCRKTLDMDYEVLDGRGTNDLRTRIENDSNLGAGIYGMNNQFQQLCKGLLALIIAVFFLVPLLSRKEFWANWSTPVFLAFVIGLSIFSAALQGQAVKKENRIREEFDEGSSRSIFLQRNLTYREGKDIRVYKAQRLITDALDDTLLNRTVKRFAALQARFGSVDGVISGLLLGGAYVFVVVRALSGALTPGDVVLFASSIYQFCEGLKEFVRNFSEITVSAQRLQSSFDYLNLPDKMKKGSRPVTPQDADNMEIEFRNVSFHYPDHEKPVLQNISVKFDSKQKIAVVGKNGSGKSTFIKLLCRLYDPTGGQILLNGVDIREYDYPSYLRLFSVVFQDFKLLAFPLGENVAGRKEYDPERAESCLRQAGLGERLGGMKKGLDTCLYRELEDEGVEISGGEAQKIALARALYKNAPFIVLDEPTAALDPISEYEVYSGFKEMVRNKTSVFISHRLSSCRFCDDILVFREGKIVQRGDHDTLVEQAGEEYETLWNAQAQYYTDDAGAEPDMI